VSSIAATLSAVRDDRDRPLPAVRLKNLFSHIYSLTELFVRNCRRKSSNQMFIFSVFVREFVIPWWVFWQKISYIAAGFDQNFVFRTRHVWFHCIIIITHEVTRQSKHWSVTQLWRHQAVKQRNYGVFFFVLRSSVSIQQWVWSSLPLERREFCFRWYKKCKKKIHQELRDL